MFWVSLETCKLLWVMVTLSDKKKVNKMCDIQQSKLLTILIVAVSNVHELLNSVFIHPFTGVSRFSDEFGLFKCMLPGLLQCCKSLQWQVIFIGHLILQSSFKRTLHWLSNPFSCPCKCLESIIPLLLFVLLWFRSALKVNWMWWCCVDRDSKIGL